MKEHYMRLIMQASLINGVNPQKHTTDMSLFGNPRCPQCGRRTAPTGYSFPYPQWRCVPCLKQSNQQKSIDELKKEITELKDHLKKSQT